MMKDAESHAEEDRKRKEEIETRNRADQAVYAAEKMITEMGDKLTADDKAGVQTAIETLKTAINANDTAGMNRAMEQLTQVQHKAAEALYKNAGAQGAPGAEGAPGAGSQGSPGSTGAQDDVIDAEVVDEDKK